MRSTPTRRPAGRVKSGFGQSWDATGESAVSLILLTYGRQEYRGDEQ
jgi:hypothetical protein